MENVNKDGRIELPQYILKCPDDNTNLYFELIGTMRVVRDNYYDCYCPKCNKWYKIKQDGNKTT